ncbi:unconventional myosin-XIX isoform X2 [Amia ocellicauda]|uniref:unconventional myosin-XIX isoform X2 n=1 Tax=Amia ocellicauda TaxID=2972642 RepID=UPI003464A5E2
MIDDLTKVNPVTPATVLICLGARYSVGKFYTHAGCSLVALNPFQPLPQLYSLDAMKEYHCTSQPQECKPHIFLVAEQAYRNLQMELGNQSIIISGESGAGKTWTTRSLMKYYSTVAAPSTSQKGKDTVDRVKQRVLDSNPVMEAFGNACTSRNNNSSRFGKYIQLQFNSSQELVGAKIQTFLLEKTRVACPAPDEHNFHIFYQMMDGASEQERQEWHMPHDAQLSWLPNADRNLEDSFAETRDAMTNLGIDCQLQEQIFQVLAGILQLGNVDFSASDESRRCELQEQSKDFLQKAATLLELPTEELLRFLTVRPIRAGGEQRVLTKPCSQAECITRRDCLAKLVYARVFDWLVEFTNQSICAVSSTNFIGLLDVYGFESFKENNLEQVCVNYANEKLQQHFVRHFLKKQQEENIAEGLDQSFISYQDNQSCLALFEDSPNGIFSLLNEECRLNRRADPKNLELRLEKSLSGNPCMSRDKFDAMPHFIVSHYADDVCYQIEGMVEKNKDPVPPELIGLLRKSQKDLLSNLFAHDNKEQKKTRGYLKVITVVSKFKSSLDSLMDVLDSTTPHYIRCIKPNTACQPLAFEKEEVMAQLEACGIVESVKISAAGFPIRIPNAAFMKRYGLIANVKISSKQLSSLEASKRILGPAVRDILCIVLKRPPAPSDPHDRQPHSSLVHCGNTKVFITPAMLELLEAKRNQVFCRQASCIQRYWRRYCSRKQQQASQRHAATVIQAAVHSWLLRRDILKRHTAATCIQRVWRTWRATTETLGKAELVCSWPDDQARASSPANSPTEAGGGIPVVESQMSVSISAVEFPIRILNQAFVQRYGLIANWKSSSEELSSSGSEASKGILGPAVSDILCIVLKRPPAPSDPHDRQPHSSLVHCGNTKVFITPAMLELLEALRNQVLCRQASCIQRYWRRYCSRKQQVSQRHAATVIQAAVRSWLLRRDILKRHTAATCIQRVWRTWRLELMSPTVKSPPLPPGKHAGQGCSVLRVSSPRLLRRKIIKWQRASTIIQRSQTTRKRISVSLEAMMEAPGLNQMAGLKSTYQVKANQFEQGVASIRAYPQQSIDHPFRQSSLKFANVRPHSQADGLVGFNQILLEQA